MSNPRSRAYAKRMVGRTKTRETQREFREVHMAMAELKNRIEYVGHRQRQQDEAFADMIHRKRQSIAHRLQRIGARL